MEGSAMRSKSEESDAGRAAGPVGVPASVARIWGVLNVTPDSFSDGGRFDSLHRALDQARRMLALGADVIDVGGESSRPQGKDYGEGHTAVSPAEEIRRVVPVIEALAAEGVEVSVDTVKADVAEAACAAGARWINDVSMGADEALLRVAAARKVPLVLMHNRGKGETGAANTYYDDVVSDVVRELGEALQRARSVGVRDDQLWIDPGLGFAKTAAQSMELLARTAELRARLGLPILVGPSRKSFIARTAPDADGSLPEPARREAGTAAACTLAVLAGADALRVHDVHGGRQAALLAHAARQYPEARWTS